VLPAALGQSDPNDFFRDAELSRQFGGVIAQTRPRVSESAIVKETCGDKRIRFAVFFQLMP